jgi:transketolase
MADAIRMLAVDAVEKAKSGHPGAPMGMAEMAVALWHRHLKHNPANPAWPDRDRFVLSNGHASMLLYALLHLSGYDAADGRAAGLPPAAQPDPGPPEVGLTPGVETTTGPLGQGFANAVGMALAETRLATDFNRDGHRVVDHFTWVFLGDGCLMEGVTQEAASLAGTLRLAKLIALYDDNGISIDGHVEGWFADDTPKRFEALGWSVVRAVDGHDVDAVDRAIAAAKAQAVRPDGKPTLICCKTVIGRGSPNKAGTPRRARRRARRGRGGGHARGAGLDGGTLRDCPDDIAAAWNAGEAGAARERDWRRRFEAYRSAHPAEAAAFERRMAGALPTRTGRRTWRPPAPPLPPRPSRWPRARRARTRSTHSRPACRSCSVAAPTSPAPT